MAKRIACYIRISTDKQCLQTQRLELEKYAERQKDWRIVKIYEEQASGSNNERPVLAQVVEDAQNGDWDILLVYKTDRLGRSTQHLLYVLTQLTEAGVSFHSATEAVSTATSQGRMLLTFLSGIAEFERELIRERVISGLSRAKQNGIQLGRPRKGFNVAEAIQMQKDGFGFRRIAKRLGVSHATVFRSLKSVSKTLAGQTA